ALVIFGSYRYAERLFLLLSLVFVTYPIAAFLGHPRWSSVAADTLAPHFVGSKSFVLLGVALIGTTITPYMQLYVAAAVADKGIGPDEYRYERVDTIGGAVMGNLISGFIIIATGAALGRFGQPLGSAKEAAQALRPVAGSASVTLFGLGLLGASMLAGAVVPLATAYAVSEALGVERSVSRTFTEAPLFLSLFSAQIVIGASVALLPGNLVSLLINTQTLNGLITPVILVFILVLANRRSLLGEAANGPTFKVVSTISVVAVAFMAITLVVQTLLGWFGLG
ncbi:MAG: divalent metal cation transporter, partial [Acidobacteriota bacterium]|nr:divalent metal cation transporter [Acidobacteriota bacterium]